MDISSIVSVVLMVGLFYFYMLYRSKKKTKINHKPVVIKYDSSDLKELKINIPAPKLTCVGFHVEDTQYRAVINEAVLDVKPQEAYPWILIVHADLKHVDKNGFPEDKEAQDMYYFFEMLNHDLAVDEQYPNAVFLGRVVGKGCEVLHWYLHNVDLANDIMGRLSLCKNPPVKFDYEIKEDKNWEYAHCLIDPLVSTPEVEPNNNFQF